jgi:hypothetical protein
MSSLWRWQPALLLGGVIGFISLLHVQRVPERCRALHATGDSDLHASSLALEISRFERRSKLLIGAIQFAVGAGIATAFLIIIAFVGAPAHINLALIVALLFIISLALFVASHMVRPGHFAQLR